uniref:RET cysteine rich domain-containing protein n=1 Tax=Anopheles dirus TaxID=7168 RepID=A0A182NGN9_9DIPT
GDAVGHFRIVFTDDDSIPVNTRVHYKLHGDTMELFHPDCAMYENEHDGGLKQTVFGCKLIFARSGILRNSPYCVTLQAIDQTVEQLPYDAAAAGAPPTNATVCLTTNLNRIHEHDLPRPEALTSNNGIVSAASHAEGSGFRGEAKTVVSRRKSKKEANPARITYPKEAVVYDTSRKYARIAEPKSFKQLIQENSADLNFRLASNPLNAFGITTIAGIVYLKNETAFQNKPESRHEITVAWKNYSTVILIRLRKNPDVVQCAPVPIEDAAEDFCAAHANRSSCMEACGIGSLLGPCEYRPPSVPMFGASSTWSEDYPTCSSGLLHCPDDVCDPLEDMGHREKIHICPQDCVFKQDILGVHHSEKLRGIQTAAGHCKCRASGHCMCDDNLRISANFKRNKTITTTSSSTSTTTTTTTAPATSSGNDVELVAIGGKNHSSSTSGSSGGLTPREMNERAEDAPPAAVRDGSFYEPGLIKGPHASMYLIAIVLIPMVVAVMIVLYCFSRKMTVKNKLLEGGGGNGAGGGMNSISMNLVSNDTEIFNVELPLTSRINEINFKIDRPSFKHLAGQFELLLGRSAKYIDMEQNSISNPVYCVNVDETDCAKMAMCKEEQDRLESLWTPPQYESVSDNTSTELTGRYQTPSALAVAAVISPTLNEDKKQLLLQSYDTPRPLIETTTIEQKLRYENDVRLRPKKLSNASDGSSLSSIDEHQHIPNSCGSSVRSSSTSPPRCLRNHFEETSFITSTPIQRDREASSSGSNSSEYDSPSRQPRRVLSYVDMNKNNRHLNANLEINHMIDKKQSKDIALRFSNVDNELQMVLVDPLSGETSSAHTSPHRNVSESHPASMPAGVVVLQQKQHNADDDAAVVYTEVVKKQHVTNGKEPLAVTIRKWIR